MYILGNSIRKKTYPAFKHALWSTMVFYTVFFFHGYSTIVIYDFNKNLWTEHKIKIKWPKNTTIIDFHKSFFLFN